MPAEVVIEGCRLAYSAMLVVTSVGVGRTNNTIAVVLAGRPHRDRCLRIISEFALFMEDPLQWLKTRKRFTNHTVTTLAASSRF